MVEEVVGGEKGPERGEGVKRYSGIDFRHRIEGIRSRAPLRKHGGCALPCTLQHRFEHPQENRVSCTIFRKIN